MSPRRPRDDKTAAYVADLQAQIRDLLEEREELLTVIRRLRMGNHPAGRALPEYKAIALAEALTERDAEHEGGGRVSTAETVEKTLAQHATWSTPQENRMGTTRRWYCSCGEAVDDDWSGRNILARHRRHVAAAVVAALEAAR